MGKNQELLISTYLDAKEYVIEKGYAWELDWQTQLSFNDVIESQFLAEAAWVILASGFRESVVRKIFPAISIAFLIWESANRIKESINHCKLEALTQFRNERKINAICNVVNCVAEDGFEQVKSKINRDGLEYLKGFPFIGPVTGLHLLKNLGMPVSKPDRHLVRIAEVVGFKSSQEMCELIQQSIGDCLPEIDIVLWRYSTLRQDYLSKFQFNENL